MAIFRSRNGQGHEWTTRQNAMPATPWEFRHRMWIIGLIYGVAFACYAFDPENVGQALAQLLEPAADPRFRTGPLALHAVFGLAALLVVAAAALRTWGTAYLQSTVVHDSLLHSEALVADGPYRHVRNPLYLGGILMSAGIGILASRLGWLVLVALTVLFYQRLIQEEESVLLARQGEPYRAFLAAVPRLWPALRPRLPASGRRAAWGQALAGEIWIWAVAAATVWYAMTLNRHVGRVFVGAVLLGYAGRVVARRFRRRAVR